MQGSDSHSPFCPCPQSFITLVLNAEVWDKETLAALGTSLQAEFRGKFVPSPPPPPTSLHPSILQLIEIMTQLPGPGPL